MTSLGSGANSSEGDRTNLGKDGNQEVSQTFQRYVTKHSAGQCAPKTSGAKRVLVTGFGLFVGVPYNISGTVVRSMADESFWPSIYKTNTSAGSAGHVTGAASNGVLSPEDFGGWSAVRTLTIDNQTIDVCFLLLDVKWDLAAAITLHEIRFFQPDVVLMSGRGGSEVSLEWGAINRATLSPGFDSHGQPLPINKPVENWVLKNHALDSSLQMTWDGQSVGSSIRPLVKSLGYKTLAQNQARLDNTYICNNISFAVMNGILGYETVLAGEMISLVPPLSYLPKLGFFHYPAVDTTHSDLTMYSAGVYGWGQIMAKTIWTLLSP